MEGEPGRGNLPHHYQETDVTCGPAAIKMALDALLGVKVDEETLAVHLGTNDAIGTRQRVIERFIERVGLEGEVRHTTTRIADLREALRSGQVVLVCYFMSEEETDHYALVVDMTADHIVLHDPWYGPNIHWPLDVFDAHWFADPAVPKRQSRWMLAIHPPTGPRPAAMLEPGPDVAA